MKQLTGFILARCGVDPRSFFALTSALILMDFRGPHYSQSTGVRPREVLSPLFCVIGQCLALSAVVSLVLFLRVDIFFYAFAGLAVSILVIGSAVVVEYSEVVFDARDEDIIAPRPVSPRTYLAARFANLLFYVLAMWLALNLFPTMVGAAMYDAGIWYAPAYLLASLSTAVLTTCGVILLLSSGGGTSGLRRWKEILAWTQVLIFLIVGYGAQLMFRRRDYVVELWAAFPPDWIRFLPPTWLAWFVEDAAVRPSTATLAVAATLLALSLLASAATVSRLASLQGAMQPVAPRRVKTQRTSTTLGGLSGNAMKLACRGAGERVGFWMFRTLLARDAALRMRCLYALNMTAAVVILGLGTGQFSNPAREREISLITLPLLSVYLTVLAVPVILYNSVFVRDSEAAWMFAAAPVDPPAAVARGVCKAIQVYVITPACLALGVVYAWAWQDSLIALLTALLTWALSWTIALASLWLAIPSYPFSRDPARGGSLGPIMLPLAAFSCVLTPIAALHYLWSGTIWFWIVALCASVLAAQLIGPRAEQRVRQLVERAG